MIKAGDRFCVTMYGRDIEGVIQIEDGQVFLCQNSIPGAQCNNKFGYSFSWHISTVEDFDVYRLLLTNFKILYSRKSRIQSLEL